MGVCNNQKHCITQKHTIIIIKDSYGRLQEDEAWNQVIPTHFVALFSHTSVTRNADFLDSLRDHATEDFKIDLSHDYTKEEVKVALQKMHSLKALGLDG